MTRMGRPPLRTKLKLLRGERRESRLNREEPEPVHGPLDPPDSLDVAARIVWVRVLAAMAGTDVITSADADLLAAYCDAVVRYERAAVQARLGPTIRGRTATTRGEKGELIQHETLVKNPAGTVVRQEAALVLRLAGELGLTPSSRAVLRGKRPAADPFEEYLAQGRRRGAG